MGTPLTLESLIALCAEKDVTGVKHCVGDDDNMYWFNHPPHVDALEALVAQPGMEIEFSGYLSGHSGHWATDSVNDCGTCTGSTCADDLPDEPSRCVRHFTAEIRVPWTPPVS